MIIKYPVVVVEHGNNSLETCPHCGEKPKLVEYRNDRCYEENFSIKHDCHVLKDVLFPNSRENIIALWNQRN